jgi:MraZ protein
LERAYCGSKWSKREQEGANQGASWELWPVAGFVGRYEHSLDTKGRVILPAKFRASFERGGYLTEHREGCLALWTPGEFERQMGAMQERAAAGRTDRNRARLWAANSHEVEVDRQGRMAIPARLRDFAQLEGDVLVNGAIDRVELWSPAVWERSVQPEEQWFLQDEDD